MQLKSTCGPRAILSGLISKHYAPNWFNCPIVCPFWAKSGKYYSKMRGKLQQLRKERTVITLGFYLIRGKLQLLQYTIPDYVTMCFTFPEILKS